MSVSRRQFCRVTAGLCASQAVLGTASAQTSIEVSGTVRSDGDSEVAGAELRFSNTSAEQRAETTIQSNGEFTVVVPEPGTYRVTLFDESPERDGVPAVYSFNNVSISETGDIGELSLSHGRTRSPSGSSMQTAVQSRGSR